MQRVRRLWLVLAALAVFAAACGGDSDVTADQADAAQDQIDEDLGLTTPEEAEEPATPDEPVTPVEPDEPDEPDVPEEPPGPVVNQACITFHHYPSSSYFPDAPYHAVARVWMPVESESVIIAEFPGGDSWEVAVLPGTDDNAGFDIYWPVFGPGQVDFPTVTLDGVDITDLVLAFFGGETGFVAAGSDLRDEDIYPNPCPRVFMVEVEVPGLTVG